MFDKLIDKLFELLDWFMICSTVHSYERGVVLRFGVPVRDVGPGLRWHWPLGVEQILTECVVLDTKHLQPQSLTTQDKESVVVSVVISYKIDDVRKTLLEVQGVQEVLSDTTYGVVARLVSKTAWSDLASTASEARLTKQVRDKAEPYGIGIVRVQFKDCAKIKSLRLLSRD